MALVTPAQNEQKNVVVNESLSVVFFQSRGLAYNWKTEQWSRLNASVGKRFFAVEDNERVLGTVEASGSAVMVQDSRQTGLSVAATATFVTGEFEFETGRQVTVDGMRPITDGASLTSTRIGVRDLVDDAVTFVTGSAINSRSGFSGYRGVTAKPTGQYARAELIFEGGFTTVSGAEFEFFLAGEL